MAKALKTVASVAGIVSSVARFIPGPGQVVAAVAAVVAVAASIGAEVLQKKPAAQGSLSETTIGTNLPIPYVIGETYCGGNLLHDVGYGAEIDGVANPYRSMIYEWSLGPVQSVTPMIDFAAPTSYYNTWLTTASQLGLVPEAAALAGPYGAIPDWGASYKTSGHATTIFSLRFDRKGKVWASGVPPLGALVAGPKAYDPRQDSTYPGGSGACRPRQEDTYLGGDVPKNAGCAGVTYAMGRYQNGKYVFGPGFEFDEIDWAAWVGFMNVCDDNEWQAGGTIYEAPGISKWENLKRICAAGGGVPIPSAGGLLSVTYNAPKVALDTITRDDLADGEISIPASRPWRDRFNTIVPRYRSAAHRWEYVQSDEVAVEDYIDLDGEAKVVERQYDLVQDKDQAAQLASYELFNARELAGIVMPLKPRLSRYRIGDALEAGADIDDETALGGMLLVITGRDVDPLTGKVTLTFATETNAKHAAALGQTGTAPPVPTLATGEELDTQADSLAYRSTPHVVNSEAAMLALDVMEGEVALRTDVDKTFIRNGDPYTGTIADWFEAPSPAPTDPDAADIDFVPAGSIAATNVQAAIEELDAEKAPKAFRGALVRKASNQTGADFTTRTALTWDSEGGSCYDTDAFHDTSTNTDRLTVPSGVTKVRLQGQVQITSLTADLWARLSLEKNGSLDFDGVAQANTEVGNTTVTLNLSSPVIAVAPADYFKLTLVVETDTAIDITASRSWFALEVVE